MYTQWFNGYNPWFSDYPHGFIFTVSVNIINDSESHEWIYCHEFIEFIILLLQIDNFEYFNYPMSKICESGSIFNDSMSIFSDLVNIPSDSVGIISDSTSIFADSVIIFTDLVSIINYSVIFSDSVSHSSIYWHEFLEILLLCSK